jgi:hypothetical protein
MRMMEEEKKTGERARNLLLLLQSILTYIRRGLVELTGSIHSFSLIEEKN